MPDDQVEQHLGLARIIAYEYANIRGVGMDGGETPEKRRGPEVILGHGDYIESGRIEEKARNCFLTVAEMLVAMKKSDALI